MTVILHLAPGVLTGIAYFLLARPAAELGLPSIAALLIAGVFVIIPFELGIIAWAAREGNPQPVPIRSMIRYREPIPFWHYLVLIPLLFVATGLLFGLLSPVSRYLQNLFVWLPSPMVLNMGLEGAFPRSTLIWVTILNALLLAIVIPIVEEAYFRGFLLPRMPETLKGWAPLANSFLFAVYHTWSPWMIITRTIGLLPLVYLVRRERNVYLGMIVHCLANLVDIVTLIVFIAGLS